jgi:hypothetical protein
MKVCGALPAPIGTLPSNDGLAAGCRSLRSQATMAFDR